MGVALSLLWLTLCYRDAGAYGQRPHQHGPALRHRNRVVGPASGRNRIPARQRCVHDDGAQVRRKPRRETPVLQAAAVASRAVSISPAARAMFANAK
jgi:hypothetical protein